MRLPLLAAALLSGIASAAHPLPDAPPPHQHPYPIHAQTPDQQATDRYRCHGWAVQQTGFDPAARGYSVR